MATKKISELEAITEADGSDVLAIVDVSEGKTNKITKNNLLIGAGHSIEMSLNQETYALTLTLKNAAGTELSTASIDLPNENSITNITYNNGKLTLTKQSGSTTEVDISGLINGLATETALTNLANALKQTIGIQTNTYDNTKTYNTGDIVIQNEKIYKANQDNITGTFDSSKWDEISLYEYQKLQDEAIEENYKVITKLQEDVEDLTERVEDAENNEITYTLTPSTSHYLQDSADARFRRFIPIGRTTQESNNNVLYLDEVNGGSNEIEPTLTNGVVHVKGNNNSSYNSKGFYQNGFVNLKNTQKWKSNTRYYISCKIEVISNPKGLSTSSFVAYIYGEKNTSLTYNSSLGRYVGIIDTSELTEKQANKTMLEIRLDGTEVNISEVSIKTEDNYTFTGYGNYPSPEMESPIKSCGDNVNILNPFQAITKVGVTLTVKEDGTCIFNGTARETTTIDVELENPIAENTNIAMSLNNKEIGNLQFTLRDSTKDIIGETYFTTNSVINVKRTVTLSKTAYYARFQINSGATFENFEVKPKIEQGSVATPYSPYGCGNVNEKVQNKNLIDVPYTKENPLNVNGAFATINLDLQADKVKNIIKAGDTIRLSCKAISNSGTITRSQLYLGNGTNISYLPASMVTITNQESTISNYGTMQNDIVETGTHQLMVVMYASSGENYKVYDFMIEKVESNGEVTYVPHSEQNISFPLAQGQKFYEGSHPDDDEKVHHKWGEVDLSTLNWIFRNTNEDGVSTFSAYLSDRKYGNDFAPLCDYLKFLGFKYVAQMYSLDEGFAFYYDSLSSVGTSIYINVKVSQLSELQTWLQEKHPKLLYPLAEEQTEDFTEEQKTAWEEWKKARTYKNVTHISSEDETPANVEIEYVQDTKTYIDNQIEPLKSAIISLGGNV